jgi:outer membrane protein assembly factor BamA
VPYSEQFFIGGSSSIRAFRIRTLGPGSFRTESKSYQANESGEIKLEMNLEARYSISKLFKLAVFTDVGNIWLRKDAIDKPGSGLDKGDLYKELAVGAGIGFRIDASVLVLRFDVATPLRKPWYNEGNRWVLDEIRLGDKSWRKENLILNIGIGYPF